MARQRFERVGGILSYFTRHRTAANLLLVLMIVSGLAAFPQMRAQFFPDVVSDEITVSVGWDGAGAEDVDVIGIERDLDRFSRLPHFLCRGAGRQPVTAGKLQEHDVLMPGFLHHFHSGRDRALPDAHIFWAHTKTGRASLGGLGQPADA